MDETLLIILLSLYGFFTTVLFVCVILACRLDNSYETLEET